VLGAGCQSNAPIFEPVRASSMREAGSVHVAVLAVAPWSEYVGQLQPDFNLTADQALSRVAKDSQWRQRDDATAAGVGAESVLLDETEGGGRVPQKPESGLAGPLSGADPRYQPNGITGVTPYKSGGGQSGPGDKEDDGTGSDSMLKYTAAASLFQEVKLLNGYIRDAAIPAGFRPYMVRLQVSLMPSRRHAPYDAYTTLSFFIPGDRAHGAPQMLALSGLSRTTSDTVFAEPFGNGPKVLPVVVTDNLEASVQSRSFDRVSTLLTSLLDYKDASFIEPMYGALVYGALRDQVFGRDLNSLLTVARVSENTLRIRLGASQEATANYAMVPRNHNVTLLLMVPEGSAPLMEVVSKTVLVDAETGESLDPTPESEFGDTLEDLQDEWDLDDVDLDTLARLHALARANDQEGYASLLRSLVPAGHPVLAQERSLWIELVSLTLDDQYTSNLFELPGQGEDPVESSTLFTNQTVVLDDDGTRASVVLREARFPESVQILAMLTNADSDPPLLLPAESVQVDMTRRELHIGFPSLSRWRLLPEEGQSLELTLTWPGRQQVFAIHSVAAR
jgi:hypothetical protein